MLTEKEILTIYFLYEKGINKHIIAKRLNRHYATICKYIRLKSQILKELKYRNDINIDVYKKIVEFICPKNHKNTLDQLHLFIRNNQKYFMCEKCNCAYIGSKCTNINFKKIKI